MLRTRRTNKRMICGQAKTAVLIVGSLPPPMAGVERAVVRVASLINAETFDTQVHSTLGAKGSVNWMTMSRLACQVGRLIGLCVRRKPTVAVLALSQNVSGLARDSLLLGVLRVSGVPTYGWVHGAQLPQALSSGMGRLFRLPLGRLVGWVVPNPLLADPIATYFPARNVATIPHSVDFTLFAPAESQCRREIDFAFIGKVMISKGWNDFASAISDIASRSVGGVSAVAVGEQIAVERNLPNLASRETLDVPAISGLRYLGAVDVRP